MPFLGNLGTTEILIIGIILVVLFGGKKLSQLARGLGESGKELKNAKKEFDSAINETEEEVKKATKTTKVKVEKGGAKNV